MAPTAASAPAPSHRATVSGAGASDFAQACEHHRVQRGEVAERYPCARIDDIGIRLPVAQVGRRQAVAVPHALRDRQVLSAVDRRRRGAWRVATMTPAKATTATTAREERHLGRG